jgi:protein PET100
MYLAFPIGYMYYFGTNLEERFNVPDFWPTKEQSNRIPYERDEIRAEVERIQRQMRDREQARQQRRTDDDALAPANLAFHDHDKTPAAAQESEAGGAA